MKYQSVCLSPCSSALEWNQDVTAETKNVSPVKKLCRKDGHGKKKKYRKQTKHLTDINENVPSCSSCYPAAEYKVTLQLKSVKLQTVWRTLTVNIQIESNKQQLLKQSSWGGRGRMMEMKEWGEKTIKSKNEKEIWNEASPLAFLMTAKLKWMLQLMCIYIGWSNKKTLIFLSPPHLHCH